MYVRIPLGLFLLLFIFSCKKETAGPVIINCEDDMVLKAFFEDLNNQDLYIRDFEEAPETYLLFLADGSTQEFEKACFLSVEPDPEAWLITFTLHNEEQLIAGYGGTWQLSTVLNPSGYAPLAAELKVSAPIKGRVHIRVIGKNGNNSDVNHLAEPFATTHELPILGLYPDFTNSIEVSYTNQAGKILKTEEIKIETAALPEDVFPEIIIDVRKEDQMDGHFTLISYRGASHGSNKPFFMDAYGDIRWYLNYESNDTLDQLGYDVGIERLANGNYYFGNWGTDAIYEVNSYGEIVNNWPLPGYQFHHNVQEKPDGNFLVTVSKEGSLHENAKPTKEDYVLEIDRNSGAIVNEWDLKECLDENRIVWENQLGEEVVDWFHGNAVIYDPSDNTIIVSGRHQGVVKLDYNNQVKWIMAPHLAWTTNRQGQNLNQFLLAPLNAQGGSIEDQDIIDGHENHPDFEWNWYQHAPKQMPNGNIILFDNGSIRNFDNFQNRYSRAVEFAIDEENKTIQQIWQYGKERGKETFGNIVSDVDYLANKNNVLFAPGAFVDNNPEGFGGKIIEIDYTTQGVVFEAKLISSGIVFHRVERLSMYPN